MKRFFITEDDPSDRDLITDIPEQYRFLIIPSVTGEEGVEKALLRGGTGYIEKQVNPDTIMAKIQECL